jgi:glucose/arabinose dehydrogenase
VSWLGAVIAVAVALTVAACGDGGDGATTAAPATTAAAATTAPAPATSEAATAAEAPAATGLLPDSGDQLTFKAEKIGTFDRPVWVGSPPNDDRIFVVEQHVGRIMVVGSDKPFLTLPEPVSTGNEQGLLGLAFHPDFATNGRYFVNYTNADGDTRVVEFHSGDSAAVKTWLEVDQPYANHNGGNVLFGPDGRLYVGMGDGGSGGDPENRAQDRSQLLGKLLSIDVDGGDPKPKIAAIGLRNPWRFSFSPDGKQILIGDVGQNAWEEIDRAPFPLPANANFGWRLLEATHEFADGGAKPDGYIGPVFEYSHDNGGCSVTGGVQQANVYLFGDYCSGQYWAIQGDRVLDVSLDVPSPVSFGEDGAGNLLLASGDGGVYRVTPT